MAVSSLSTSNRVVLIAQQIKCSQSPLYLLTVWAFCGIQNGRLLIDSFFSNANHFSTSGLLVAARVSKQRLKFRVQQTNSLSSSGLSGSGLHRNWQVCTILCLDLSSTAFYLVNRSQESSSATRTFTSSFNLCSLTSLVQFYISQAIWSSTLPLSLLELSLLPPLPPSSFLERFPLSYATPCAIAMAWTSFSSVVNNPVSLSSVSEPGLEFNISKEVFVFLLPQLIDLVIVLAYPDTAD